MDLKQKFKSFVKQVPSNLSSGEFKTQINLFTNNNENKTVVNKPNKNLLTQENMKFIQEQYLPIVSSYEKQKELREIQKNPFITDSDLEHEIINSIDEIYYRTYDEENKEHFDPCEHILNKLPEVLDLGFILEEKKSLNKKLVVVTKRVSDLISKNEKTYCKELVNITELLNYLNDAIKVCSLSRNNLKTAKITLTYSSLTIISSYQKRKILLKILDEIWTIKTIQESISALNELIVEYEDYPGAIKLCLDSLQTINSLDHYKCINELCSKIQYTLEVTEEKLNLSLAKMCLNFNSEIYEKLYKAFVLLDKEKFLLDQLVVHFSSLISTKVFNLVSGYVELCSNNSSVILNLTIKNNNFVEICKLLSAECFLPCLIDLNKALWYIMLNFKRILHWHEKQMKDNLNDDQFESDSTSKILLYDTNFKKQKLKYISVQIWQDVKQKLIQVIQNHKLSIYSFDDFILMLNIVRKMMEIGFEFSGDNSHDLEEILKNACFSYFYIYHKNKMENIKIYLDTELWENIPMKRGFNVKDLHEFTFLNDDTEYNNMLSKSPYKKIEKNKKLYFNENHLTNFQTSTPFDDLIKLDKNENLTESSEKVDDPEISNINFHNCSIPIVTNSSLNILKVIGKYLQIMCILNKISFDVLLCIFHLFDYYLYGIYLFFGDETMKLLQNNSSLNNLRSILIRIESTVIFNDNNNSENKKKLKFYAPTLSSEVVLNNKDDLYGLLKRAVGVESLIFLADQFKIIYDKMNFLISDETKIWLDRFFKETIEVSNEMRIPVYMYIGSKSFQFDQVVSSMEKINWEVKEIMSQHNFYVDQLIQELQIFRLKETDLVKLCCKLPPESSLTLWKQIFNLTNKAFIEGFSTAKKCTPCGRALMQLDYQQFLSKIENIVRIKPIPNKDLVDEYIKAYYYTEEQLENLIKSKKEYSIKQLKSLVNCVLNDNKKARNKLISLIESEYISFNR